MFILKKRASYIWPVSFRFAGANGRYEDHDFNGEFKRIPQERIDAIIAGLAKRDPAFTDDGIVREVLIGWKDVTDEAGDAVPFNEDTLAALLSVPGVRAGIIQAFFASIVGIVEKN